MANKNTTIDVQNPVPAVRRQNARSDQLPGAGFVDPVLDQLVAAADAMQACPDDSYSADIKAKVMTAHNAAQRVRSICWTANDIFLQNGGAARGLIEQNMTAAAKATPSSGYGMGTDYEAAKAGAAREAGQTALLGLKNAVLAQYSGPADDAAKALAQALDDAGAAVEYARQTCAGPLALQPDMGPDDVVKADAIEAELTRNGLKWGADYWNAAVTKRPEKELRIFAAASLRGIQKWLATPPPVRGTMAQQTGSLEFIGLENEGAYDLSNALKEWLSAHSPKSIDVGADALAKITAVAFEMCGPGNIARLSAGAFENTFLSGNANKKRVNQFQMKVGFLATWMAPKGSPPPGYSPLAGRSAMGAPYRFAKGAT